MNAWEDLGRRLMFMRRELLQNKWDPSVYSLVLSRDVFVAVLSDAPPHEVADYHQREAFLMGHRLRFADDRTKNYVALVHEVRG